VQQIRPSRATGLRGRVCDHPHMSSRHSEHGCACRADARAAAAGTCACLIVEDARTYACRCRCAHAVCTHTVHARVKELEAPLLLLLLLLLLQVRPIEDAFKFGHFFAPLLNESDFEAKPSVLMLGQYSSGARMRIYCSGLALSVCTHL